MRRLHSHEWEHLIKTKDDEIERLRGEISLAEEGLANYAQENAQLREALLTLSILAQRISEEAVLALARNAPPQSAQAGD